MHSSPKSDRGDESFEFDENIDGIESMKNDDADNDSSEVEDTYDGSGSGDAEENVSDATVTPRQSPSQDLPGPSTNINLEYLHKDTNTSLIVAGACVGILAGILLVIATVLHMIFRFRKRKKVEDNPDPRHRRWEKGYRKALMDGEVDV